MKVNNVEDGDTIVFVDGTKKKVLSTRINRVDKTIKLYFDDFSFKYNFEGRLVGSTIWTKNIKEVIKNASIWKTAKQIPRQDAEPALLVDKVGIYRVGYIENGSFLDEEGVVIPRDEEIQKWCYIKDLLELETNKKIEEKKIKLKLPQSESDFLKNCPFCGGKAVRKAGKERVLIRCEHCGSSTKEYKIIQNAINMWNRRV